MVNLYRKIGFKQGFRLELILKSDLVKQSQLILIYIYRLKITHKKHEFLTLIIPNQRQKSIILEFSIKYKSKALYILKNICTSEILNTHI